ncbi:MAG: right-handed parallel beta-helix repeat-containing protein [Bacteroidales bacterium]|nr:right-handed parallel beta-helix repeat-containing protein [Bacteroidales bacterium]
MNIKKCFVSAIAMVAATALSIQSVDAQGFGKSLLSKAKSAVTTGSSSSSASSSTPSSSASSNSSKSSSSTEVTSKGKKQASSEMASSSNAGAGAGVTYYVSMNGGARANGLSPETPMKDIQKALNKIKENKEDGATVKVAEGNYLGSMNAGYIEVSNFITLEGGYSEDFSKRDPQKYITRIQPTQEQNGTNGNKALITMSGLDDVTFESVVRGTIIIDGFCLDHGLQNFYLPAKPDDPRNGCPSDKFETGRIVDDGSKQLSHQSIHSDAAVAGNVIIRNCLIANSPYFGIQFNQRNGKVEIYNNVIIGNRFGGVRIDGWDKTAERCKVDFHHNTVIFSWCRDKEMGDMGYGYEFMNNINGDLHHNIFACNNYAAVARTRINSDKKLEAKKVTNLHHNAFFMNAADLQLPSKGGGKWTNVKCANFEDLDESLIPEVDGNFELQSGDPFIQAIDQDYLKGFATLKVVSSQSFNGNSAANQFRSAMGMNQQGTETIRVSMYGNRYNFDKAMKLFGAKEGYGAQKFSK